MAEGNEQTEEEPNGGCQWRGSRGEEAKTRRSQHGGEETKGTKKANLECKCWVHGGNGGRRKQAVEEERLIF